VKTIEYWHPKRGIGGPALEDSDHAFLYEVKENEMEPVVGMIKKYDDKRDFWVVRPLKATIESHYYLVTGDFDYRDPAVNDLVEVYYCEKPGGAGYRARRHGAKAYD
jgi:hypothetical protein